MSSLILDLTLIFILAASAYGIYRMFNLYKKDIADRKARQEAETYSEDKKLKYAKYKTLLEEAILESSRSKFSPGDVGDSIMEVLSKFYVEELKTSISDNTYTAFASYPTITNDNFNTYIKSKPFMDSVEEAMQSVNKVIEVSNFGKTIRLYILYHHGITMTEAALLLEVEYSIDAKRSVGSIFYLIYEVDKDKNPLTTFKGSMFSIISERYKFTVDPFETPYKFPINVFKVVNEYGEWSYKLSKKLSELISYGSFSRSVIMEDMETLSQIYKLNAYHQGKLDKDMPLEKAIEDMANKMKYNNSILLCGFPGSGKSYLATFVLIKEIFVNHPDIVQNRFKVFIISSVKELLDILESSTPDLIDDSIVILDDVDLNKRALGSYQVEILNKLFNGPMNMDHNILFVITTNTLLYEIPQSLIRTGRTAVYEIRSLNKDEFTQAVKALSKYRGIDKYRYEELLKSPQLLSVAEVFAVGSLRKNSQYDKIPNTETNPDINIDLGDTDEQNPANNSGGGR